jgi:tetratricopeptide (TPR) repeat protein
MNAPQLRVACLSAPSIQVRLRAAWSALTPRRSLLRGSSYLSVTLLLTGAVLAAPVGAQGLEKEADRTVAAAREAAREHRNAQAAVLFEWAISQAPSRRREWLLELAEQMTYSGRSKEAVPLFREVQKAGFTSPEEARRMRIGVARALSQRHQLPASLREYQALLRRDANDIEARLECARVLSWMDRHVSAKREYEAVLRQDPRNEDARRGLAQVQSWRGRHRDAQRRLSRFLQDHPEDEEATRLLAQSQEWMGRPDRAERTLRGLLARRPQDGRALELLGEIESRDRPESGLEYQQSQQSDDLTISSESFQHDLRLNNGRTTVGPRYQHWGYEPEQGPDSVSVERVGAHARHRFSDRMELNHNVFVDRIEPSTGKERTLLTYDTYLTLWPNDTLRFDIGSNRTTFDNVKSLKQGITATAVSVSMDVVPDRMTRLTTRFNWADYSDGNHRRWTQLEAERRVGTAKRQGRKLFLGGRYTHIDYDRQLNNGYFNPKSYRQVVATARFHGRANDRLSYDFEGSYGREDAEPDGRRPFSSAGARLSYKVKARTEIEVRHSFFSSEQVSSGGFSRQTTAVSVRFGL